MVTQNTYPDLAEIVQSNFELVRVKQFILASDVISDRLPGRVDGSYGRLDDPTRLIFDLDLSFNHCVKRAEHHQVNKFVT